MLTAFQNLLNVLGPDSPSAHPAMLPVLRQALAAGTAAAAPSPSSSSATSGAAGGCQPSPELLEDGLQLLLVAARNAPGPCPPLAALFPALGAALAGSFEHIAFCMQALTSLALLDAPGLLGSHGPEVAAIFGSVWGAVNERGMLVTLPPADVLLTAAPAAASGALLGPLAKLLGLLLAGSEGELVAANALALFARLLLASPPAFQQLFAAAAAAGVAPPPGCAAAAGAASAPEALLAALLALWLETFDSISNPAARRLSALALCASLGLPSRALLPALPALLPCVVSVWLETEAGGDLSLPFAGSDLFTRYTTSRGDEDGGAGAEPSNATVASEEATGEVERRRALAEADPINRLRLRDALREGLAACAALHGADFHAAMAALHPTQAEQLRAAAGM